MITLELDQVEIDYCLACRGVWLDSGELEQLLGDSGQAEQVLHSFRIDASGREAPRRCPICGKKMEKVLVGPQSEPVLIDRCRKAHGLWFDQGELEAILQKGRLDPNNRISDFLNKIFSYEQSKYPSMSYEEGVEEALRWVLEDIPDDEFEFTLP